MEYKANPKARYTKKAANEIFLLVGQCIVTFAALEAGLDLSISYIHNDYGGSKLEIEVPRTGLKRKLTYLCLAIKRLEDVPRKSDLKKLIAEIKRASKTRNLIAHGVINISSTAKEKIHLHLSFSHYHGARLSSLSRSGLSDFCHLVNDLAQAMGAYTGLLMEGCKAKDFP